MERYPHQEPVYEMIEHRGKAYAELTMLPTRAKSFTIGMIFGYALAIVQMGTLLVLLINVRH